MVSIAIFASGNGSNFENIVNQIQAKKVTSAVCKVLIVDKEKAYAIQRAKQLQIPCVYVNPKEYASKEDYETKILEILQSYGVQLIVLAGYMRFIGRVLLNNFDQRIINLHPAYLPAFPGAHSIQDAFEAKAEYTGVTVHYVDEGVDTGTIIHQEKIIMDPSWTLETLEEHVHAMEYKMFPEVVQSVCEMIEREALA
ncbi:phosphoribosylglycinamide formyltransferase [Amedibacillus sp. YH-ame10]